MSIIQIKRLNAIEDLNCVKQQQIHGGDRDAERVERQWINYSEGKNNIKWSNPSEIAFLYEPTRGNDSVTVVNTEKNKIDRIIYPWEG